VDVLIDTNAIQAIGLDGTAVKALRSYLSLTKARLFVPSVVLEELCANRQRELQKLQRDLAALHKDLRRLVPATAHAQPAFDSSAAVAEYRNRILNLADNVEVVSNHPDDLGELVRRLTNRVPPASPMGEEARDVLIWLAVLFVARNNRVALITGDKKAFMKDEQLRPELIADLGDTPSRVSVFRSIDDFLRTHHARSSFIDIEWVEARIADPAVEQAVSGFVSEDARLFEWEIKDKVGEKGEPTGYLSLNKIIQHGVKDFFVSDLAPDELYVSVTVWAELEVEFEYAIAPDTEARTRTLREYTTDYIYPSVEIDVELEVQNQEITDIHIGSMEPA
jgi:rRNA-processing protein FCF1